MTRLEEELLELARRFNAADVDYAICGAVALSIHGHPRATTDIDFVVTMESMFEARRVVKSAGFIVEASPMKFGNGAVHVFRLSKFYPNEEHPLTVDLLVFRTDIADKLKAEIAEWNGEKVRVVTRETLVYLKRDLSTRPQDHVDIQRLLDHEVED